jgi:transposase
MELRKETRVFVKTGFTDMRKQINGLAAIVQQQGAEGPFDGSYYVFCGKTRRVAKILYWDKTGFCLWQKRLEQNTFPWPREGSELNEMTRQNIRLLLKGIDVWKEHKALTYKIAG